MYISKRAGLVALCALLLATGCDSDKTASDGGASDGGAASDGSSVDSRIKLYPCDKPGQSCNAHNSCAINPLCGKDKLCRPTNVMNCNDDHECTVDSCGGTGLCLNTPKTGTCLLNVRSGGGDAGPAKTSTKCYKKGDKHPDDPCRACQPSEGDGGTSSNTTWSPINGGACDDKNACTKDDYCQEGICKGTSYASTCDDNLTCTVDGCDGKGGCLKKTIKSGNCLIDGKCYKDKDKHPSGSCNICDVSKSTTKWTAITNTCLIDNKCYNKGDKNPGGCAECDPATSTTAWTVKGTTHCLISGSCVASGTKDPATGSCASCQPSKSKTSYSADAGYCKILGKCIATGTAHPDGCAKCDSTKDRTTWTPNTSSDCVINHECGEFCSSTCVNTKTDSNNCGKCGTKCASGEACFSGKCAKTAGIHLSEVHIGTYDYVVIKNVTSSAITLTGYTLFIDDSGGSTSTYDWAYNIPTVTLAAGKSYYLCESAINCPTTSSSNMGKNILYDPSRAGSTYLCKGTCSSTTVIDLHSFAGSQSPNALLHSAKFTPSAQTGITSSNASTQSFVRKAYTGYYPNFYAADWKVDTASQ